MSTTKVRVLLVDDRPENLMSLEATLASDEYELIKAGSGADALRYLLDNDCAIILLDVQMPGMDGYETADLIKKNPKLKDIPIIFLTALNHDARYVARGYRVGAVDYISKPIVTEYLQAKVAVFAQLHRARMTVIDQGKQLREHEKKEQERRLAEVELKALRREQALARRYKDLVEGMRHAVVWVAEPGSLVVSFVSASVRHISGHAVDPDAGDQVSRLVHPDDRAMFEARLRALKPDVAETIEHRLLRRGGEIVWMSTTARLEKKLDRASAIGNAPALAAPPAATTATATSTTAASTAASTAEGGDEIRAISIDVTEAKQVERTLRLLADLGDGLGATLETADIARRLAQACVPDVGDGCTVLIANDDGESGLAATATAWATPEQAHLAAAIEHHPAWIERFLTPTTAPVVIGKFQGLHGVYGDTAEQVKRLAITSFTSVPLVVGDQSLGTLAVWSCNAAQTLDERSTLLIGEVARRAAQALHNARLYRKERDAVAHRDEFLSVASHELRTPLTALKMGLQTSVSRLGQLPESPVGPVIVRSLHVADRQVDRLQLLVDSLLDVSRIRAGRLELDRAECELSALVTDVVARFQPELDRKHVKLTLEKAEQIVGAWDKSRLDQVITNLISNAVKYGEGKPVEVAVERQSESARIVVRDHGIGISSEDAERIFGRFERAVSSRKINGLGLGLYITRQIVRAHGGDIRVESAGQGAGSRFLVDLPLQAAASA